MLAGPNLQKYYAHTTRKREDTEYRSDRPALKYAREAREARRRGRTRGYAGSVCVRSSTINCCWELTPSFPNAADKWFLTVLRARCSESAIRGTRSPARSRNTISSSRSESRLRSSGAGGDVCDF